MIPRNGTFVATASEEQRMSWRPSWQARFELVGPEREQDDGSTATAETVAVASMDENTHTDQWPLRISPERYLQLYPQGPNVALARAQLRSV